MNGMLYLYATGGRPDGLDVAVGRHLAGELPEGSFAAFTDVRVAVEFARTYGQANDLEVSVLPSVERLLEAIG